MVFAALSRRTSSAWASPSVLAEVAVFVALLSTGTLGHLRPAPVEAQTPSPDISFGIDVDGDTALDCDTFGASPPEDACVAGPGTFTVKVSLNTLSGLADLNGNTTAGYTRFGVQLQATGVLTTQDRPGTTEVVGPQCGVALENPNVAPSEYFAACELLVGSEMTFLGKVFEVGMNCGADGGSGEVRMKMGGGTSGPGTFLFDEDRGLVRDQNDKGADEVVTIDCRTPGAAKVAAVFVGIVAAITVAALVSVLALSAAVSYLRRRFH